MMWLQMFWEFFKAGLFAVGGGLATLPFLYDISQRTGWFTAEDIANMIAISESTPGPLGVNMATYAGFEALGIPGGIYTTLSLTAPAIIVISMVYSILKNSGNRKSWDAFSTDSALLPLPSLPLPVWGGKDFSPEPSPL